MKTVATLFMISCISLAAFAQQKEFPWLLGKWKLKDKPVYEQWTAHHDTKTLIGRSYRVKDGQEIVTEEIRFTFFNNRFHYVPDVAGDQGPVDFEITSHSKEGFVAENPKHDFPKLIRYTFTTKGGKDMINASIEGDGKVISYQFERME